MYTGAPHGLRTVGHRSQGLKRVYIYCFDVLSVISEKKLMINSRVLEVK